MVQCPSRIRTETVTLKHRVRFSLMGPVRVCFVVNAVDQTVAEVDIAVALQRYTDAEVTVMAWFYADDFYGDEFVDVVDLAAPNTRTGIDYRTLSTANDVISDVDIVQTTHNHAGTYAKLLARYHGIPSVSREGNTRDGFPMLGLVANGLTNPLADRVICNSRAVHESFRRWETLLLDTDAVEYIPNGVDIDAIDSATEIAWTVADVIDAEHDTLVGTTGSLTEQKNQSTLIRGVARARERGADTGLVIVGDGPCRAELTATARDEGISDSVHFLGRLDREQVYCVLHEIDIYSMPSLWEGFSMAAVEAAASGTACVFSDIDPFVEPYEDIAMFHGPTDVDALADILYRLSTNPDKRRQMGDAAREAVENRYTLEAVARQYWDVYEAIR